MSAHKSESDGFLSTRNIFSLQMTAETVVEVARPLKVLIKCHQHKAKNFKPHILHKLCRGWGEGSYILLRSLKGFLHWLLLVIPPNLALLLSSSMVTYINPNCYTYRFSWGHQTDHKGWNSYFLKSRGCIQIGTVSSPSSPEKDLTVDQKWTPMAHQSSTKTHCK